MVLRAGWKLLDAENIFHPPLRNFLDGSRKMFPAWRIFFPAVERVFPTGKMLFRDESTFL